MSDDGYFNAEIAAVYDDDPVMFSPEKLDPVADFLAELAGGGAALEFGIGTGRIALPLAARGVPVSGIDLSQAMLDRLAAKPGGSTIATRKGDFATGRMPGSFNLVYLVYNTINNLLTQAAQVACFKNAAARLAPGGHFVVEVMVPELQRLPRGETLLAFSHGPGHWGIDEYDVVTQNFSSHHSYSQNGKHQSRSIPFRYVWPSELDLMAELAGMVPSGRFAGWKREEFTNLSTSHVSVWQKPS